MSVRAHGLLFALLLLVRFADSVRADDGTPRELPPRLLARLQRDLTAENRWWISGTRPRAPWTGLTLDAHGVSGTIRDGGAPTRAFESWSTLTRIESRRSRFGAGTLVGGALGAVAGGYGGAAIGEQVSTRRHSYNDHGALTGLVVGGVLGAVLGGRLGDRQEEWQVAYDAGRPTGTAHPAELQRAAETRIRPGDQLRVRGAFGEFAGSVGEIGGSGLSRLKPDPRLDLPLAPPREPIAWSEIESLERRGHAAGRGAIIGAALLGGVASAIGGAVSAAFGSDEADVGAGFFVGAMFGAPVGALTGAAIGRAIPAWHRLEPETGVAR